MNQVIVNGVDLTEELEMLREEHKSLQEAYAQRCEAHEDAESAAEHWRQRARTAEGVAATLTVQGLEAVAEAGGLARRLGQSRTLAAAAIAAFGYAVGELSKAEASEILAKMRVKPLAEVLDQTRRGARKLLEIVWEG